MVDDLFAGGVAEIEQEAFLAALGMQTKDHRVPRINGGSCRLDERNLGTKTRQGGANSRPGDDIGQVQYPQAFRIMGDENEGIGEEEDAASTSI